MDRRKKEEGKQKGGGGPGSGELGEGSEGPVVVDRKGKGFGEGRKANTKKKPIVRDVAPQAGNSRISEALIGQIFGDAGNRKEPFPNTDSRKVRRPLDATQRHLNNEQQHKHTKPTTDGTTNTTLTLNTHTSDRFY